MAIGTPRTLLSLDRFAAILGLNPLHFNQVTDDAIPNTVCSGVMKQYAWQHADAVARDDIAQAISEAESTIRDYVGYALMPDWVVDQRIPTLAPSMPELFNFSHDVRGFRQSVQLPQGAHFISGGIEAKDLIDADAAVVYTDEDGDGYAETATVTVTIPATGAAHTTLPAEIAVYYPGVDADGIWEVRPLRSVVITGATAVIRMWRQQLVVPELLEALQPEAVDGGNDANFLDEVEVRRHWNNPAQQAELMWSPTAWWWGTSGCGCGDAIDTCVACTAGVQDGCLLAKDYRLGIVHYQPATWDATEERYTAAYMGGGRNPDRLRLWYYAGYQDTKLRYPTLQMDPAWERAVAYYAVTLLDRMICACSNVEMIVKHWRTEMNLNESFTEGSTSYQLGRGVLDNPFGQTRGAVFAWKRANLETRKIGRAAIL